MAWHQRFYSVLAQGVARKTDVDTQMRNLNSKPLKKYTAENWGWGGGRNCLWETDINSTHSSQFSLNFIFMTSNLTFA